MPFTFKLSKRLALTKAVTIGVLATGAFAAGCELPLNAVDPSGSDVAQILVVPASITLEPTQAQQFQACGRTQAGDSVAGRSGRGGGAVPVERVADRGGGGDGAADDEVHADVGFAGPGEWDLHVDGDSARCGGPHNDFGGDLGHGE